MAGMLLAARNIWPLNYVRSLDGGESLKRQELGRRSLYGELPNRTLGVLDLSHRCGAVRSRFGDERHRLRPCHDC